MKLLRKAEESNAISFPYCIPRRLLSCIIHHFPSPLQIRHLHHYPYPDRSGCGFHLSTFRPSNMFANIQVRSHIPCTPCTPFPIPCVRRRFLLPLASGRFHVCMFSFPLYLISGLGPQVGLAAGNGVFITRGKNRGFGMGGEFKMVMGARLLKSCVV